MHRLVLTVGLVGVLGFGTVACGSSTKTSASNASSATTMPSPGMTASTMASSTGTMAGTMAGSTFNVADTTFVSSMIPHHQQAVTMADMALDTKTGASAAVKDLATRIKAAQGPEITTMQGWLSTWGVTTTATTTMGAMGPAATGSMEGMMSDADMTKLGSMTGTAFDTMWLTMMVAHHQGAVAMAQAELSTGASTDAKALATKIIAAQNAEIAEMKKLLG